MSRSKVSAYLEGGEADYDEAGSPRESASEEQPQAAPVVADFGRASESQCR